MKFNRVAAPLVGAALIVTACSGADTLAFDEGSAAFASFPAAALPAPDGPAVVTITGDLSLPNVGDEVQIDAATLQGLADTTIEVYEPFVNDTVSFTGARADDFLAAAGIEPDTPLVWTALDDYQVSFTRAQLANEDAVLALESEGEILPIEEGGPLRVVFPRNDGPLSKDGNEWIWSIKSIEAG